MGIMLLFRLPMAAQDISDTIGEAVFVMKFIHGGVFEMGCTWEQGDDCWRQEIPPHLVDVEDFLLGETEVTQALWEAVMGERSSGSAFCADCPVHWVSWHEAQDFVRALNRLTGRAYRLPTEAEWEYAARGGVHSHHYRFAGSHEAEEVAWFGDFYGTVRPVARKFPNELGLYDMSGNVWEWCQDRFGEYSKRRANNPRGPHKGEYRVIRGGSWYYSPQYCRVTYRANHRPTVKDVGIGFRLALTPATKH
jgi:sulfatase modifying factor 1